MRQVHMWFVFAFGVFGENHMHINLSKSSEFMACFLFNEHKLKYTKIFQRIFWGGKFQGKFTTSIKTAKDIHASKL